MKNSLLQKEKCVVCCKQLDYTVAQYKQFGNYCLHCNAKAHINYRKRQWKGFLMVLLPIIVILGFRVAPVSAYIIDGVLSNIVIGTTTINVKPISSIGSYTNLVLTQTVDIEADGCSPVYNLTGNGGSDVYPQILGYVLNGQGWFDIDVTVKLCSYNIDGGDFINISVYPQSLFFSSSTHQWTVINEPLNTHIDFFSFSTSTLIATSTGYINSGDYIEFWQVCDVNGISQYYEKFLATSTGFYTKSYQFYGCPQYTGTTTIGDGYTIFNSLDRYDYNYYDPFGTEGLDMSQFDIVLDQEFIYIPSSNDFVYLGGGGGFSTSSIPFLRPDYDCSITNVYGCIQQGLDWAFVPDPNAMQGYIQKLKDGFITKFPIGYFYVIYDVLTTTATSSLPVLSATIPNGIVGAGASISLDFNHSLDWILNATTSQFTQSGQSSDTLYEIVEPYWNTFVYIALGFYIITRFVGSGLFGGLGSFYASPMSVDDFKRKKRVFYKDTTTK